MIAANVAADGGLGDGWCWSSAPRLAACSGVSTPTVLRTLKALVAKGWLTRSTRVTPRASGTMKGHYRLTPVLEDIMPAGEVAALVAAYNEKGAQKKALMRSRLRDRGTCAPPSCPPHGDRCPTHGGGDVPITMGGTVPLTMRAEYLEEDLAVRGGSAHEAFPPASPPSLTDPIAVAMAAQRVDDDRRDVLSVMLSTMGDAPQAVVLSGVPIAVPPPVDAHAAFSAALAKVVADRLGHLRDAGNLPYALSMYGSGRGLELVEIADAVWRATQAHASRTTVVDVVTAIDRQGPMTPRHKAARERWLKKIGAMRMRPVCVDADAE